MQIVPDFRPGINRCASIHHTLALSMVEQNPSLNVFKQAGCVSTGRDGIGNTLVFPVSQCSQRSGSRVLVPSATRNNVKIAAALCGEKEPNPVRDVVRELEIFCKKEKP